jgi:hypothetical protein
MNLIVFYTAAGRRLRPKPKIKARVEPAERGVLPVRQASADRRATQILGFRRSRR